jgi:hypothetical protein
VEHLAFRVPVLIAGMAAALFAMILGGVLYYRRVESYGYVEVWPRDYFRRKG